MTDDFVNAYQGWSDPTPTGGRTMVDDPFAAFDHYINTLRTRVARPLPTLEKYYASRATSPQALGMTPNAPQGYIPAGPPERFQFNLLDPIGKGIMGVAQGPLGVAAGLAPAEQRGGTVGPGIATAPVNFQNFATYAREAPLSVITGLLGHKYQQTDVPYGQPVGPVNNEDILRNISQGDFEGVLDNVIDGLNVAGDAISAPFIAMSNQMRHSAANDRAKGVAELYATGHGTPSILQFVAHLFDQNGLTQWESIAKKAEEKGVTMERAIADLWDLNPEVVAAIAQDGSLRPDASGFLGPGGLDKAAEDKLWQLTEAEPFSYDPATNLIAELGVTLAPMLIGAGELRGLGLALKGGRVAATGEAGIAAERAALIGRGALPYSARELGLAGRLAGRVVPGNVIATAERIGAWSLPKAWRWVKPAARVGGALSGLTPTGIKLGAGIRVGEWMMKQAYAWGGNDEAVKMMDRWLWEMPLSNNPGLMMADAFMVHPLAGAKGAYQMARKGIVRVFGHGDLEVGGRLVENLGSLAEMDLPTLQARVLNELEWDAGTVGALFDPKGATGLGPNDLKNGLFHTALEVVRARHEAVAARISPEAGAAARDAAFVERYGEEAARLLRDEVAGRSTEIRQALRVEFWTRSQLIDASELGQIGMPGPYEGHTALIQFASWLRASKAFASIAEEHVAALRTDVNTTFVREYRQMLEADYKPSDIVKPRDVNRLVTFVPAAKRGRGLGARKTAPKLTRRQIERVLDELATGQDIRNAELSRPRAEAVPALRPADVENPAAIALAFKLREATVDALMAAREAGTEQLGAIPGDLAKVLQGVFRMTTDYLRREPAEAWARALDWFTNQYDSAAVRGQAIDTLERLGRVLSDRYGGDEARVIDRLTGALVRPAAESELAKDPILRTIEDERQTEATNLVDAAAAWLDDPKADLVPQLKQAGDVVVLETTGFKVSDVLPLRRAAESVPGRRVNAADAALLADPAAHPLELAAVMQRALDAGWRPRSLVQRAIVERAGDLEGEYGPLFDEVYADKVPPVSRDSVAKLTTEIANHSDALDRLREQVRGLTGLLDKDPRRPMSAELRELIERGQPLGSVKIGRGPGGARVESWRNVRVEPEAVIRVANERAVRAARAVFEHRIATRESVAERLSAEVERIQARMSEPITSADVEWTEGASSIHATKRDARTAAKELEQFGVIAGVQKVGSRWHVRTGTLRERPAAATPEAVQAAYDAGQIAEGQALNREVAIARGGTPDSGGAVKAEPSAPGAARLAADAAYERWRSTRVAYDQLPGEGSKAGKAMDVGARKREISEQFRAIENEITAALRDEPLPAHPATPNEIDPRLHGGYTSGGPDVGETLASRILRTPDADRPRFVFSFDTIQRVVGWTDEGNPITELVMMDGSIKRQTMGSGWRPLSAADLNEAGFRTTSRRGDPAYVAQLAEWEADVAPALVERPVAPPELVSRVTQAEAARAAQETAYASAQAERQAAFRAQADAYPAKRAVPVTTGAGLLSKFDQTDWMAADQVDDLAATIGEAVDRGELTPSARDAMEAYYDAINRVEAGLASVDKALRRKKTPPISVAEGQAEVERLTRDLDDQRAQLRRELADEQPTPVEVTFPDPLTGEPVRANVVIVDAADVLTSDQPGFLEALQPRDRAARVTSEPQIKAMSADLGGVDLLTTARGGEGMPVVTPEGLVLAGNGRTAAVRIASKKAYDAYRTKLAAEAPKYGFDPAVIEGMDRPLLVRELVDVAPDVQARLAWQLNDLPRGELAPVLGAAISRSDVRRLKFAEGQDVSEALVASRNAEAVGAMLNRLPRDWRNRFRNPAGALNDEGVKLIQGALLSKLLRADDRTLPGFDAARRVVLDVVEQGGEEMRRISNGLFDAALPLLKAQDMAEAGQIGREFLTFNDDLAVVLGDILAKRAADKSMAQIGLDYQTINAFADISLTPQQTHLGRLLVESAGQAEVATFLRAVAEAAEKNAPEGGSLFAEAELRMTPEGMLNEGIRAWNDMRAEAGRSQLDPFPSGEPPFDTALTGPRELDGATLPPVTKSVPLAAEEIAAEIAARTAGEPLHHVVRTVDELAEGPGTLAVEDVGEARYADAVIADPAAVLRDVEDVIDTIGQMGAAQRGDYFAGLLESQDTLSAGDWLALHELGGGLIRRDAESGRLNMTYSPRPDWATNMRDRLRASIQKLAAKTIAEAAPGTARVVRHGEKIPLTAEQLAANVGPDVPHEPPRPVADAIAAEHEHTLVVGDNPQLNAAVRRAVGAPAVQDRARTVIELNAPTKARMAERISALRQQALAEAQTAREEMAAFDANPTVPVELEQGSVFANAEARELWTRYMGAKEEATAGLGPAFGVDEPTSLAQLTDAIESLDRDVFGDLKPEEARLLRAELMRLATKTLDVALERKGVRAQAQATRRTGPPPDDMTVPELHDRVKAIMDDLGPMVVNDSTLSPLDGFAGTQYVPSLPPTKSRLTGEPIAPRILFRDRFVDDMIPGLREEIASGRMMEFGERVARSRVGSLVEHVLGPRSERELRMTARRHFEDAVMEFVDPDAPPAELAKVHKTLDAWYQNVRDIIDESKMPRPFSGFRIYRRIDLLGPEKVDKAFAKAVTEVYGEGQVPDWVDRMKAGGRDAHTIWRRADNRLRNYLAESRMPFARKLAAIHGAVADVGVAGGGEFVQFTYTMLRFTTEIRWLSLEAVEPFAIVFPRGGLQTVLEAQSKSRYAKAKAPLAFGSRAMEGTGHWAWADQEQSTATRMRYLHREIARLQAREFPKVVREAVRRDPTLRRLMVEMGDRTPADLLERLDRDFGTVQQGRRPFRSTAEAETFFGRWRDAGIIDEATYRDYAQHGAYDYTHPAIEAELNRVAGDPMASALYERLAALNHGINHDVTATLFGQENRSNLQRLINHPLLWWPVSYQIKATKWLLRFMLEEQFGVEGNALGGFAFQQVYDEQVRRLASDPEYARRLASNKTLYFVAMMFFPIFPTDVGVSLAPWTRMLINPEYQRQLGIFGWGPFYTYLTLLPTLINEQLKPGGAFGDADPAMQQRLRQAFPETFSGRTGRATSRSTQSIEDVLAGQQLELLPPEAPVVPRLP